MHYLSSCTIRRAPAILAAVIIFLWKFLIPSESSAASVRQDATLLLQVRPEAMLHIVPVYPTGINSRGDVLWFQVQLAIRLRPGSTAWLRLDPYFRPPPDDVPGTATTLLSQPPIFTARRNGRYHFQIGVPLLRPATRQPLRFVLESSDQMIYITQSF